MGRYGWRQSKPDHRDLLHAVSPEIALSLPERVDLTPLMPPIYDQGDLGSCTANAVGAVFEYAQVRFGLSPDVAIPHSWTPSRLFIYYNERVLEDTVPWDAGAELRDAIKAVVKWGACPEMDWKYDVSLFAVRPPQVCYDRGLNNQGLVYSAVGQSLCQMQSVLASGFPFIVGFTVYESFESAAVAATGTVPMPHPSERVLGGHAVVVVGYDNATRRFLMRNSWGTEWGAAGYFTFPYEFLTSPAYSSDFWVLTTVEEEA